MFQKRYWIIAVGVAGAVAAAGLFTKAHAAAGHGLGHFLRMAKVVLSLSDSQETEIRGIVDRNLVTARPLLEQLQQSHDAFQLAIENGKTDPASVQPLADQVGRTVSQLALIRTQAAADIYKTLTPEQRTKAKQLHDQFRNDLHRRWLER